MGMELKGIQLFFKDRYLKGLINEQKNSRSIISSLENMAKEQVIVNI